MSDDATATGATPGSDATSEQAGDETKTPPTGATPPATADPPATGDEALGEAGKAILRDARRAAREAESRAEAAQAELQQLREASQSDQEKVRTQAVREAVSAERARWQGRAREAEVRGALRGAGIASEKLLSLAVAAPELRDLKVDPETGAVEGVAEAISAFRKDSPELFRSPDRPGGPWGGAEGGSRKEPETMQAAVLQEMERQRRQ